MMNRQMRSHSLTSPDNAGTAPVMIKAIDTKPQIMPMLSLSFCFA